MAAKRFLKKDLTVFKKDLQARQKNLLQDVKLMRDEALSVGGQDVSVDNMADHGSESFEQDFTLGLIESDAQTLKQIKIALEQIEKGAYGVCIDCDGNIPKRRLQALPFVQRCVTCKEKFERETGVTL